VFLSCVLSFNNRAKFNTVGGTAAGVGNVIAFNGLAGVFVDNNRISRNSIFSNLLLEIDLTNDANDGQSAPQLTSTVLNTTQTSVTVQGSISGQVGKSFTIEFFASDPGDPQGKKYLGSKTVTVQTNNAGTPKLATQNFTVSFLTILVSPRDLITATATDSNGNTSEFSDARVVR
jgi:hypothetical protein